MSKSKMLAGGFAALAGVMALGSSAWGCVVLKGSMTATNVSGSDTVIGSGSGYNWCTAADQNADLSEPGGVSNSISLSTGPGNCNGTTLTLRKGRYRVGHAAGLVAQGGVPYINCHATPNTVIGIMSVNAGGYGSGTYSYASPAAGVGTNLCVYGVASADGNSINVATV